MIINSMLIGYVLAQRFLQADTTCYGVILDCGSSSTKTTIYTWPCRTKKSYPSIDITQQAQSLKSSPGISTQYPDQIATYLAPIFTFVNSIVPANQKEFTPIFMGATAGMRLLDINRQNQILDEVRKELANSGYLFEKDSWARVISGQDEASYLWLTVKYLLNNTDGNIITVDLGGASTQIAFQVAYQQYNSDINVLTMPDSEIDLYAISFLGFGNDQSRISVLAQSITGSQVITPCYHAGYTSSWTYNSIQYTLQGTGDYTKCKSLISTFINSVCRNSTDVLCGINGIPQPTLPSTASIYAVSGVATMASFLSLNTFTLPQFLESAITFCSLTWAQVQANSTYAANSYVATNYFMTLYVHELLSSGYNIPDTVTINSPSQINSQTPTWAMAAVQYQLAQLNCDQDSSVCSAQILLVLILILLII